MVFKKKWCDEDKIGIQNKNIKLYLYIDKKKKKIRLTLHQILSYYKYLSIKIIFE